MATNELPGLFKYKDEEGNINLLLPITTIEHVDGMDEIEASLSETLKFTAQDLTEEQKTQARTNLGVEGKILPSIAEGDNDKLLMVENGEAIWIPSSRFVKNNIAITSCSVTPHQAEMGDSVDSVSITWDTSMTPLAQSVDGVSVDASLREVTLDNLALTDTKTWNIAVTDEYGGADIKPVTLNFLNGIYYGAAAIPETLDSTFILGLCDPVLTSSKSRTITVFAEVGKYIWYALPSALGECIFTVGGFEGGFCLVDTITFTNAHGHDEPYYIYRSEETIIGETKVVIG